MVSDRDPSGSSWRRRYADAATALWDTERVLVARERVEATGGATGGGVTLLAGGEALGSARRVGMFAGSFNPLSVAHVGVVEAARRAQRLDSVIWAFARVTVDKEGVERASLGDRVVHMESYLRHTAPTDSLAVLGAGLYADQAEALRAQLAPGAELWLVVGFDKIVQIFDPRYYADREAALRRLFAAARLLVAPRAGHEQRDLAAALARSENQAYAGQVTYLPLQPELAAISSTEGRARLARGTATAEELSALLAPEGAALALETAAYAEPTRLGSGELLDAYWLRNAWLAALASAPQADRPGVSLSRLMAIGRADDPGGAAVRRWLRGERWTTAPASLRDLVSRSHV